MRAVRKGVGQGRQQVADGVGVVFAGAVRVEDGGDAAVGVVGVGDGVGCAVGVGVSHADQAAGAVVFAQGRVASGVGGGFGDVAGGEVGGDIRFSRFSYISSFRKRNALWSSPHPAVSLLDRRESFVALAQVVDFDQVVLGVIGAVGVEDHEVVIKRFIVVATICRYIMFS